MYNKSQSMVKLGSSNSKSRKEKKKIEEIDPQLLKQLESKEPITKRKLRKMRDIQELSDEQQFVKEQIQQEVQQLSQSQQSQPQVNNNTYEAKFTMNDDEGLKKEKQYTQHKNKNKKNKASIGSRQITQFMGRKKNDVKIIQKQNNKIKNQIKKQQQISKVIVRKKSQEFFMEEEKNKPLEDNTDSDGEIQLECMARRLAIQQVQKTIAEKGNQDYQFDELFSQAVIKIKQKLLAIKIADSNQTSNTGKEQKNISYEFETKINKGNLSLYGEFNNCDKTLLLNALRKNHIYCQIGISRNTGEVIIGDYMINRLNGEKQEINEQQEQLKQSLKRGVNIIRSDQMENYILKKTGFTLVQLLNSNEKIYDQNYEKAQVLKEKKFAQQLISSNKRINEENKKKEIKIKQSKNQIKMEIEQKPSKYFSKNYQNIRKQNNAQLNINVSNYSWIQKYTPKTLNGILGQITRIKSLRNWLNNWQSINLVKNNKFIKQQKIQFSGQKNYKAVLISGSPGLGKTTAVRLLAHQFKYEIKQFNASDIRNKSGVSLIINDTKGFQKGKILKSLIIMDEVDGMSSGDRGGISGIIEMIKKTKIPIICICNDRSCQKIRSLANYCLDIKFQKPQRIILLNRLKQITNQQKISISDKIIQRLIEMFQGDIRQIINTLQFMVKNNKDININSLPKNDKKDNMVTINAFQAVKVMMNSLQRKKNTLQQRIELFFIDTDKIPLLIHQNYLQSSSKKQKSQQIIKRIVQANESILLSDIINKKIHAEQQWSLLPSYSFLSTVYPTEKVSESLGFPQFPSFLGKFSTQRKNSRLLKQLKKCMSVTTFGCSSIGIKLCYGCGLFQMIRYLLLDNKIDQTIELMNTYNITPSMLNQHLVSVQFHGQKLGVSASTSAKLTRQYNKKNKDIKITKQKNNKQPIKFIQEDISDQNKAQLLMQI